MRKLRALLAAAIAAGVLAGCGDKAWRYDFSGRWDYEERQLSSNCRINVAAIGSLLIAQDGDLVEVQVAPVGQAGGHAFGTCDPGKGTISFNWANAHGGTSIMKGTATEADVVSGTSYHTAADGCFANTIWTARLIGR